MNCLNAWSPLGAGAGRDIAGEFWQSWCIYWPRISWLSVISWRGGELRLRVIVLAGFERIYSFHPESNKQITGHSRNVDVDISKFGLHFDF